MQWNVDLHLAALYQERNRLVGSGYRSCCLGDAGDGLAIDRWQFVTWLYAGTLGGVTHALNRQAGSNPGFTLFLEMRRPQRQAEPTSGVRWIGVCRLRSMNSRVVQPGAQDVPCAVVPSVQIDPITRLGETQRRGQFTRNIDGTAVDSKHHVCALETSPLGRAARVDVGDQRPGVVESEYLRTLRIVDLQAERRSLLLPRVSDHADLTRSDHRQKSGRSRSNNREINCSNGNWRVCPRRSMVSRLAQIPLIAHSSRTRGGGLQLFGEHITGASGGVPYPSWIQSPAFAVQFKSTTTFGSDGWLP